MSKTKIIKSPILILIFSILGGICGIYFKEFSGTISFFGDGYLRILKMCIIPILVTAISLGLGELILNHRDNLKKIWKKVIASILFLFLVSGIAYIGTSIIKPGNITDNSKKIAIGKVISNQNNTDLVLSFEDVEEGDDFVSSALAKYIPTNIFDSMVSANSIQLIIFSIIFGISIGFLPKKKGEHLLDLLDSIYTTFKTIIDLILYVLPLAVFSLIAKQISDVGLGFIVTMLDFIITFYVIGILVIIIFTFFLFIFSKKSIYITLSSITEPILTAFSTRSSLTTIPIISKSLNEKLGYNEKSADLYTSLLVPLYRFGNIFFYTVAGVFFIQLYGKADDVNFITVIFTSVIAGFASIGTTGVLTLQPLAFVLDPIGIPVETAIILLIAIDPIIDPLRTTLITYCNMVVVAFIADKD